MVNSLNSLSANPELLRCGTGQKRWSFVKYTTPPVCTCFDHTYQVFLQPSAPSEEADALFFAPLSVSCSRDCADSSTAAVTSRRPHHRKSWLAVCLRMHSVHCDRRDCGRCVATASAVAWVVDPRRSSKRIGGTKKVQISILKEIIKVLQKGFCSLAATAA